MQTDTSCEPDGRVTRSLLGYGVIAGPIYVIVSLTQALTRDGFDLGRHEWSLLSNGRLGWIQITNLIVTGLMTVAAAVGLHRALHPGTGRWAPRLLAGYGLGLIGAGVFRADPALGFPPGTPAGATAVSWHGLLHFVAGGLGFAGLIAACLVLARRFAVENRRGWAWFSAATGVLFLAGFMGIASGSRQVWLNLAFTGAVVLAWAWLAAVSVHFYRRTTVPGQH
jgi:Protein of unknown function (DUF998)